MTWVLGAALPFGYGTLISDVRVSWDSGAYRDCLLKVHYVGPRLLVGFAGSVRLGFAMVEDMQDYFRAPAAQAWLPERAAWCWYRRGRRIFSHAPPEYRDHGCSLLLTGPSPRRSAGNLFFPTRCIRMTAPNFTPEHITGIRWASIGSGSAHATAAELADNAYAGKPFWVHAHGELGNPGGTAQMVAHSVSQGLAEAPLPTVSPLVVVARVFMHEYKIQFFATLPPDASRAEFERSLPRLAATWHQFELMVDGSGLSAKAAEV